MGIGIITSCNEATLPEIEAKWLELQLRIWEVPRLDLGSKILNDVSLLFSSVTPRQILDTFYSIFFPIFLFNN